MDEKLTCPWPECGHYVTIRERPRYDPGDVTLYAWECTSCQARGPWRPTRDEAVATMGDVRPENEVLAKTSVDQLLTVGPETLKSLMGEDEWRRAAKSGEFVVKSALSTMKLKEQIATTERERDEARAELEELREACDEAALCETIWVWGNGMVKVEAHGNGPGPRVGADAVLAWHRERKERGK